MIPQESDFDPSSHQRHDSNYIFAPCSTTLFSRAESATWSHALSEGGPLSSRYGLLIQKKKHTGFALSLYDEWSECEGIFATNHARPQAKLPFIPNASTPSPHQLLTRRSPFPMHSLRWLLWGSWMVSFSSSSQSDGCSTLTSSSVFAR